LVSFIYLHGLASSSQSKKAQKLKKDLKSIGRVYTPDFYLQRNEFEHMSVSNLLNKVSDWIKSIDDQIILIGSSFGGLIATRFVQLRKDELININKMILISPALDYFKILKEKYSKTEWIDWQKKGYKEIEHPSWNGLTKWSWNFISDLSKNHHPMNEIINISTLVIHGSSDEVIPIKYLQIFFDKLSNAKRTILFETIVNGDHQLLEMYDKMLMLVRKFVKINSK
jgi:pimeloyl-ACP methyl ester carboxylesterase